MPDNLDLNLSVPKGEPQRKPGSKWTIALLVLVLGATTANLALLVLRKTPEAGKPAGVSAEARRDLALRLEERGLRLRAVDAWKGYLAVAAPDRAERAKIWYRVARLYQDAKEYESAVDAYYRSEMFEKNADLASEIARQVQECYEKMGKVSALQHELATRTSAAAKAGAEGEEVVAEIGPDKITRAGLDRRIEEEIDLQLQQVAAYLPPEQLRKQKEAMLKQFSAPARKRQKLNQIVAEEILCRRARETGLLKQPDVRSLLEEMERKILAAKVIEKEFADQIKIGDSDLRTHYQANKKQYTTPESARIAHIQVKDKAAAESLIESLKAGAKFDELAKNVSQDKPTADKGGVLPQPVVKGAYIPGIGSSTEAAESIFSTEANHVVEKPIQGEHGFHVIRVLERLPERQKAFDEVRNEVFRALRTRKEREVQAHLLDLLKDRYDVVIHQSAFETKQEEKGDGEKKK